jgi:serine/threonine-protein kinase
VIAGKYLLMEKLGEGGMGAVWRAHNETLDIDVAVKLIRSEATDSIEGERAGERLLQEARAAARLGHPAIARVFDFGLSDRTDPFIVMELLKGEDLAEALGRRGRISATKAVGTLMPIAHALAAAHAKGIVHRDIKPENIYLARAEDGHVQPKLVDFGIAKIERGKNHRLTQTGTMLGSPIYMSPEQARGDDVDHLADVWAFCVVLFEMVAGRPPFEGKNYNALLYSIIADEPPTITSFGGGDDELWQILKRGFEKDPDKRWPSIRELGVALARWMIARHAHEDITGASLSAQWLRRQESGDALASMMPGADHSSVVPREKLVTVAAQGRARSYAVAASRGWLFLVAGAGLVLGVVGVVIVAGKNDEVSGGPAVAGPPTEAPALKAALKLDVAAAAREPETVETQLAQAGEIQPESSVPIAGAGDPEAKGPAKAKPRIRPATKKPKLKNPFE